MPDAIPTWYVYGLCLVGVIPTSLSVPGVGYSHVYCLYLVWTIPTCTVCTWCGLIARILSVPGVGYFHVHCVLSVPGVGYSHVYCVNPFKVELVLEGEDLLLQQLHLPGALHQLQQTNTFVR